jgi:hypothetical protein
MNLIDWQSASPDARRAALARPAAETRDEVFQQAAAIVSAVRAEGDAAIRGGAEVVDQGAAVGDALAAGPTDLLDQVRHRLGEDDVRGGDREAVAKGRPGRLGRGPERQHGTPRPHHTAGRMRLDPRP